MCRVQLQGLRLSTVGRRPSSSKGRAVTFITDDATRPVTGARVHSRSTSPVLTFAASWHRFLAYRKAARCLAAQRRARLTRFTYKCPNITCRRVVSSYTAVHSAQHLAGTAMCGITMPAALAVCGVVAPTRLVPVECFAPSEYRRLPESAGYVLQV